MSHLRGLAQFFVVPANYFTDDDAYAKVKARLTGGGHASPDQLLTSMIPNFASLSVASQALMRSMLPLVTQWDRERAAG
ncbi:hypothetical protein A4R43_12315 [Amycolatopsis albispora]|uniref:Uncharacterized protein n=2 Tax=Amycolatopsis albispora TaxID=1804986 RepID=A0A344L5B3_9PSEU|nr:hypothetical protein A4R43_12315 [Amycolatopsis albispora]